MAGRKTRERERREREDARVRKKRERRSERSERVTRVTTLWRGDCESKNEGEGCNGPEGSDLAAEEGCCGMLRSGGE